jgi:hypothetical protein
MKRTTILTVTLAALFAFAACGPRAIAYVRADHPKAQGHLTADVALVYATETAPADAQVIEHMSQTERSTDCVNATINALEKMQKAAVEKGGNALINLKAVWEGGAMSNAQGFWCEQSKAVAVFGPPGLSVWGITWEGDIAKTGGVEATPPAATPPTDLTGTPTETPAATPPSE